MRKLYILIIFFFIGHTAFSYDPDYESQRTSMIGLSIGYTFSGFRDVTIADVNRYLNTFVFSLHNIMERGSFLHSFNAGFYSGQNELLAEYPDYQFEEDLLSYYRIKDTYTRINLEYSLGRNLWGNSMFPGFLGGAMRADFYLIETLDNPVYINFTVIASLNLNVIQKWNINEKNTLALQLSFPFFGYGIRPHYIGMSAWPLEMGITSLHNYWACFGSLKYYYNINKYLSVFSDLAFDLSRIDFPRIRKDADFRIKLGAVFLY